MHLFHSPGAIIGYRQDGRPIRLIAGGSEGVPEGTPTGDGGKPPETTPPAGQQPSADPPAQETDWKAMARQWEKRAKENTKAADDLAKLKQQHMSDQEKAVDQARQEGEKSAAVKYGERLARTEFRAALAEAGLKLGDAADLIDTSRFVDDNGDVDETAIKKAVDKLSKLTPKAPATSGGDFGGGNGGGAPAKNLAEQIREAETKGDWKLARQLKSQLMLQQSTQ